MDSENNLSIEYLDQGLRAGLQDVIAAKSEDLRTKGSPVSISLEIGLGNFELNQAIVDLGDKAYVAAALPPEGAHFLLDICRGAEKYSEVYFLCIWKNQPNREKKLVAFISIFASPSHLNSPEFSGCAEAVKEGVEEKGLPTEELPIIVISKLARDPEEGAFLLVNGAPHVLLLIDTIRALTKIFPQGILVEELARPDTQALLRDKRIRKFFPNYVRLIGDEETKSLQKLLLLYFPHEE